MKNESELCFVFIEVDLLVVENIFSEIDLDLLSDFKFEKVNNFCIIWFSDNLIFEIVCDDFEVDDIGVEEFDYFNLDGVLFKFLIYEDIVFLFM